MFLAEGMMRIPLAVIEEVFFATASTVLDFDDDAVAIRGTPVVVLDEDDEVPAGLVTATLFLAVATLPVLPGSLCCASCKGATIGVGDAGKVAVVVSSIGGAGSASSGAAAGGRAGGGGGAAIGNASMGSLSIGNAKKAWKLWNGKSCGQQCCCN